MTAAAPATPIAPADTEAKPGRRKYDRSIIEGPLLPAVWKLAWPTMLTNVVGGLQGMVDQALVGNLIGYQANAAIGVSSQIFLIVRPSDETRAAIEKLASDMQNSGSAATKPAVDTSAASQWTATPAKADNGPQTMAAQLVALALGSPEFQRK